MKKIAILPTLLTLGNAVCGFAAIALASRDNTDADVYYSAILIFAAMVFDALDGFAARLSKTASDFGGQLDSLCDAISFGAAPAFLILRMGQGWDMQVMQNTIKVVAVLYMVCAVLRLARFNTENSPDPASHRRFKGLPSPGAAGCVASLAILWSGMAHSGLPLDRELAQSWVRMWAPVGGLFVAMLMVSQLAYPHLTKQWLRGRRNFSYLVRVVVVVCLLVLLGELSLLLLFWGYALSVSVRYAINRALRSRRLAQTARLEEALRR